MIEAVVNSEAAITSVERCMAVANVESEEGERGVELDSAPEDWPKSGVLGEKRSRSEHYKGAILLVATLLALRTFYTNSPLPLLGSPRSPLVAEFEGVSARYRPTLDLALNNMSFKCFSGERVGVVGRTGAGKSTITSVLFRLIEACDGKIILDGVDLGKIPLDQVRGRKNGMCIIPQSPVLFSGPLRKSVDVFGRHTDEAVAAALKSVRIYEPLDSIVSESGSNFSAGERQLICLARATLENPKLLVLDEATASVDGEVRL